MKLLWSKSIPMEASWEPTYAGVFCKSTHKTHFIYKYGKGIGILSDDANAVQNLVASEWLVPLPHNWVLSQTADRTILYLNEDLMMEIPEFRIREVKEDSLKKVFRVLRKPEKYYEEAFFSFGEYCISHKGNFGYRCTLSGKKLWDFQGQGYLYTDICVRNNRVFFGTAGQGGYFYILDLQTGETLAKIKTGGTASFVTAGNCCYVLSNDKTARLLCVSLTDGTTLRETVLPGKSNIYSSLDLMDGKIHAITFLYKNRFLQQVVWNCIALTASNEDIVEDWFANK